ncbi:UDP-N-acetylmuramate dehydrogenase [Asanoa ferruginea]|uniref:UDP-N-acetylenolpyruvoylglucosamine reductase n=1 Tax=Asanoa ferruginea TaxID=53367 RepID=A0A3D9ZH97_9ACTN|nr:UDP-N-acetylmuramate dehydrogenase [Asanoa ferruginea]REF96768.1 UDP-N-acetylmuramate dehydrogenase [Asanoa ferruginea]GIF53082.1 UDP-N-acetylenolpyruvoylglucosamine reductase [Asanoa ferruginea]
MPDVSHEPPTAAGPLAPRALADFTTLRLGGPASQVHTAEDPEQIVHFVRAAARDGVPALILAGGSNVVIGDAGVPGPVLLIRSRGAEVVSSTQTEVIVRVAAGEPWDDFVATAVDAGWSGVECLSGIPGSAGATPIQNVGAYGQEVAETIDSVEVYDRLDDAVHRMTPAECRFAYRTSVFKHSDRWVVLSVDFRLGRSGESTPVRYAELAKALAVAQGDRVPLAEARAAVRALRAGKGMVLDPVDHDTWSVGSFFTNPVLDAAAFECLRTRAAGIADPPSWPGPGGLVKVSAAWLIDKSGFTKGYGGRGGVAISGKHTLALTNRGPGSTAALLDLAREIRDGVHERFGVTLHPEPVLVNCTL